MAGIIGIFISDRGRYLACAIVGALVFGALLAAAGAYALHSTHATMRAEASQSADHFVRLRNQMTSTFAALQREVTAAPCSPLFHEQLRRIAHLPDGLHEFFHAPGGRAHCSVTLGNFDQPIDFGEADASHAASGFTFWMDRNLAFLGLHGMRGSIALQGPFATVVPRQQETIAAPDWMDLEIVLVSQTGEAFYRAGRPGVHKAARRAGAAAGLLPVHDGALHQIVCDADGMHCVASRADIVAVAAQKPAVVTAALLLCGLLGFAAAMRTNVFLTLHWSFERRFCRHLDAASVRCVYQPVMKLDSGEIAGCEVLARWRDVDGGIVFPDRFVHLIARKNLSLRFTDYVVQRAFDELTRTVPSDRKLQVAFNIFPRDLDHSALTRIFAGFLAQPDRFDIVLEIVESDEIAANAHLEIELLRRAGIRTYIDDFGTGYSNMHNLAALSVDGVKLDRSFAMAPDDSMMARMLSHAVEMIQATGRAMVVEGVETMGRLNKLRQMEAKIDYVQGYLISHPLEIEAFAAFLQDDRGEAIIQERAVA